MKFKKNTAHDEEFYRNFVSTYNNKVVVYSHLHVFSVSKAIDKTHPKQWQRSFQPKRATAAVLTLYECHALFSMRIQRTPRAQNPDRAQGLPMFHCLTSSHSFIYTHPVMQAPPITAIAKSRINGCGINYKHAHAHTELFAITLMTIGQNVDVLITDASSYLCGNPDLCRCILRLYSLRLSKLYQFKK